MPALLLAADALGIVITGGGSLLVGGHACSAGGFGLRLTFLGLLLTLRLRVAAARPLPWPWLALGLLLLPALFEFHLAGGRLGGDGVSYYVYTRSLFEDGDLDFTNEYSAYGLITRGDLALPTRTGLRRSIFAVGPGLLGMPFFALGEGVARAQAFTGADARLDGYGPCHRNATALGGLLYGFLALVLMHALLRRHFRAPLALGAVVLLWGGTFLHWYMTQQPLMSHAPSACAAALVVWLWDRERPARGSGAYALLGLVIGLAMCVRWQNGVLLLLPAFDLLSRAWRLRGAAVARVELFRLAAPAALLLACAALGASPQLLAWKVIYGQWLLDAPPHGADFLRLGRPFALETLFSSRHGLLSWTPLLWAGYLGFVPLARRRPGLALPLLGPLVVMTYVNMCSGDWWAGGSFSNRRFDALLPVFAPAVAAALDAALALSRRHATLALWGAGVPLVAWNLALAEQTDRGLIARDDTVAFPALVENAWRVAFARLGSPPTWPASWLFARRHDRPAGQYDALVGRYLFYRQNNLGGVIEVGTPGDDAFLGEGFARAESADGERFRRVRARARLFAALDEPETLELRLRVQAVGAPSEAWVSVNGTLAGRVAAGAAWSEERVGAPAALWRRDLNEVALEARGGELRLARVVFVRSATP